MCQLFLKKYLYLARKTSELCLDAQCLMKNEDIVLCKQFGDSSENSAKSQSNVNARLDETSSNGEAQAKQ